MQAKTVAIELLPDRLDVAVRRGNVIIGSKRIPIALDSDPEEWARVVRGSAGLLRDVVQELGVSGAPAVVVYRSPTQAVELVSVPLRSIGQARDAAVLSGTESLPYSINAAVYEALVVGRDGGRGEPQTHALVTAERNDIAGALTEMVESAGLTVASATPADAAILAKVVQAALKDRNAERGWLYIGEMTSFFVVVGAGRLRVRRSISIGLNTLVASLTRPIRPHAQAAPVELSPDTARQILFGQGMKIEKIAHGQMELSREQLMPLIQPVLQRLIVELRQSLRFGLKDVQRDRLEICVRGPGATIPGLVEIVGAELGVKATRDAKRVSYDYRVPGSKGSELLDAIADRRLLDRLNLLPRESADRRVVGRLRRWLWTGAAAAIMVIAFDTFRYHLAVNAARANAQELERRAAAREEHDVKRDRLVAAAEALRKLERSVTNEMGSQADFSALMQEFSRVTPQSVRLTTMSFRQVKLKTVGQITGYAFTGGGAGGNDRLEAFIEKLKASPLIQEVELEKVNSGSLGGQVGRRFEASFVAMGVPRSLDLVSNADSGATSP
ncbi:MAG: PilN domain-containing protein [Planctomycetota bacterium]